MGHSEMLLAVAGMSQAEVEKRRADLAGGDWSMFPAEQQVAFRFAHKLSATPAEVTAADVRRLTKAFGPDKAAHLIWYIAWCNYMTRVADALQPPLERTNVFAPPAKKK